MRESLERILDLQEIAGRIAQLRRDRERLWLDVKDKENVLRRKKERADEIPGERLAAIKKGDALQLKIDEAEDDIKRLEFQLNVTKHQKEYNAIQSSILSHKADVQRWEDEELEALQAVDDLAEENKTAQQELAQAEQELKATRDEVSRAADELDARTQGLEQDYAAMREQVTPNVLSVYDRLGESNMRNPVVVVKNRICQGCFTQITKQTLVLLKRDAEIVHCHSCGRVLLLQE